MLYPRSFLARRARPWRQRASLRSMILADQLDAYLAVTAPMGRRHDDTGISRPLSSTAGRLRPVVTGSEADPADN